MKTTVIRQHSTDELHRIGNRDRQTNSKKIKSRLNEPQSEWWVYFWVSLTLALTVWMYSKWPPSCWKLMGLWLKNHWKATSSEVSCAALQLSTTLSPTVTSTLLGLSSTRMASASTKLLHCHLRLTQGARRAILTATSQPRPNRGIKTIQKINKYESHSPPSDKYSCSALIETVHMWGRSLNAVKRVLVIWFWNVRALSSRLSGHNKFPGTRAKVCVCKCVCVCGGWHWGLFTGGRLVLIWQKIKARRASLTFYPQYSSHLSRAQLILCTAHVVPLVRSAGVNNSQSVVP